MLISLATAVLNCALFAFPADTPPTLRIAPPQSAELSTHRQIIAAARLANGVAPPTNTVLPTVLDRDAVFEFLNERYPESAPTMPSETPVLWLFVSETGEAHIDSLIVSTKHAGLDSLLLEGIKRARFKPALIGSVPVSMWVPLAFPFNRPAPPGEKYLPYTEKPELLNREEVSRALVQNYPRKLLNMGVGGTVLLWLRLDDEGNVARAIVREGAGHHEINQAAVAVARRMQFTPAKYKDKPTPAWITIPVVFKTMN